MIDLAQFGTGPIMAGQHGFARTLPWKINVLESGSTAICSLSDSPETLAVWPFKFSLNYSATIESDGSLTTEFRVTNTNDKALDFTALLHTYFKVPGIEQFTVAGLQGLTYQDKLKAGSSFVETRNDISIEEEVDRNYLSVPEIVKFSNGKGQVTIKKSETLPDLVLWNPWIEKSKKMSDFDDDEYKEMVCLEAGKIGKPQSLEPGQDWTASQTLSFDPKTSNL